MNAIDYSLGLKLQDYSKPLSCKIKDFLKDIVTYLTTIFMMLLLLSSGTIYPCSRKKSLDYCKSKDCKSTAQGSPRNLGPRVKEHYLLRDHSYSSLIHPSAPVPEVKEG